MTFDEARLMANVNDRSLRLFENGYRACWRDAAVLSVRNPSGTAYRVDTHAGTCDCPFFQKHAGGHSFNHFSSNHPSSRHLPCKHLLGWKRLLSQQRACRLFAALMLLRVWTDLDDNAPASEQQKQATDQEQTHQMQTFQETEASHANA